MTTVSQPLVFVLALGGVVHVSGCRRSTPNLPDVWAYSRPGADASSFDAAARTPREQDDAIRAAALAVAWHDLQPGAERCPVPASVENDLVVVIDGRATNSPRHQTPYETVVVLDAQSPERAIARVFLYERGAHRMVCGATIEVSGRERLRDALRRVEPTVLVPRGWADASAD